MAAAGRADAVGSAHTAKGLPAAWHGFPVAQISDVHVGPTIRRGYLHRIVNKVNALQADLVAITGDLVHGRVSELAAQVAPLAGPPPCWARRLMPCACCWRSSRAVLSPQLRTALTCSCQATPTAGSFTPETCWCACGNRSRQGCTSCKTCGSAPAAAPDTGARPSALARRRISRCCGWCWFEGSICCVEDGCRPIKMGVSSYLFDSACFLLESAGRESPGGDSLCFCFAKRK